MRMFAFLAVVLLAASLAFAQSVFHPAGEVAAGTFGADFGGGNFTFNNSLTIVDKLNVSGTISGNGTGLTDLNASRLAVGIVPSASVSGSYTGITGVGTLTAGALGSGFTTVAVTRGGTGISGAGGNANRVLRTSDGSTWAAAQVALATDVSGNLPVGNMPAGGSWALSSDLNIDSGKLYINDSSGNVGIGTTTPSQKLTVNGSVNVSGTVYASNISSNSPLQLQTAGTTRLYINDTTGNVGIGTASPTNTLTVNRTSLSPATLATYHYAANIGNTIYLTMGATTTDSYIQSWQGTPLIINGQGNNIILNTGVSAGNVGIGTTGPATALDINGALSAREMAAPAASPAGQGRIYFNSTEDRFKVSENASAYMTLAGFGGSYTYGASGAATTCFTANQLTGGCSCPSGFTAYLMGYFKYSPWGAYVDAGFYMCMRS